MEPTYHGKPWLAHYPENVPANIRYVQKTLTEFFEESSKRFAKKTALIFEGYKISYEQLSDMVDRFATCLTEFGITKGDSVAIVLPNIIPTVVSYLATLKIGAIAVFNNPLYSGRELEHQFNDSKAKVVVTLDLIANRIIDQRSQFVSVKHIVYTSVGDYLTLSKKLLFHLVAKRRKLKADVKQVSDVYRWQDLIAKYKPEPPKVQISLDDIAMYQYTSGTTGASKGVILTHGNISKQLQQCLIWFPTLKEGEEIALGALPFFHVMGLTASMNVSIVKGWANILVPKPEPKLLIDIIAKYRPTFVPLVPNIFINILNHPDIHKTDMTSIKACFSGSAALPVDVLNAFEKKTGATIIEGYGLTETSPVTHMMPFKGMRKIGSIGIPIPDTECRIVDIKNGEKEVPVGEPGELIIRGPQVMLGYINRPEETKDNLKDGWIYTGDIATMDDEGFFYIVDRKKDIIISDGFNVYPREIEEVFYENPKVKEACALGMRHSTRGEAPVIFIVLKEDQQATEKELLDFCKGKLADYKIPIRIEFRNELPKSNIGKILKRVLRSSNYTTSNFRK